MARLVDSSMIRNTPSNTYGRNVNANYERPITRMQVVRAYGTVNSTGVCPDGSTCTTTAATTEVEFTLNIYRRGSDYTGEVYIVNYDTRRKVNSNQLIYYQNHDNAYVLCIFCVVADNSNCNYELSINLTPGGCTTSGSMYAYVAPIAGQGLNVGGALVQGEINFCEPTQRNNSMAPICNPMPCMEPIPQMEARDSYPCVGPNIGANACNGCNEGIPFNNDCPCNGH